MVAQGASKSSATHRQCAPLRWGSKPVCERRGGSGPRRVHRALPVRYVAVRGGSAGALTLALDVLVDLRLEEGHLLLAAPLVVQQGLCRQAGEAGARGSSTHTSLYKAKRAQPRHVASWPKGACLTAVARCAARCSQVRSPAPGSASAAQPGGAQPCLAWRLGQSRGGMRGALWPLTEGL